MKTMTKNNDMPEKLYVFDSIRSIGDLGFTVTEPQEGFIEYIKAPVWQPIETAPKDGTRIIGFQKIPNSYADSGYDTFISIVEYSEDIKLWDYDAHGHQYPKHLTHWMPLPPVKEE